MNRIITTFLFGIVYLNGCTQSKFIGYKRLKITQTAVILTLTKEKILRKDTLIDSVFIVVTKKQPDINIIQFPINVTDIVDTTVIHKSTMIDYFIYSSSSNKGLYFKKTEGLADFIMPVDSVMESKIDKCIGIDTMRCLNEQPVIYYGDGEDLIYSYPNKIKSDENYDFDSVRFVYTNNERLKNQYLSKLLSTKNEHFLYRIIFYFKEIFDKSINQNIPEREVKIEISESNNFDKEELEKVLAKYNKIFH